MGCGFSNTRKGKSAEGGNMPRISDLVPAQKGSGLSPESLCTTSGGELYMNKCVCSVLF